MPIRSWRFDNLFDEAGRYVLIGLPDRNGVVEVQRPDGSHVLVQGVLESRNERSSA